MSGHDTTLFIIPGGISCKFQDFGTEVFEYGSEIDGSSSSDSGGVFSLFEETSDTTDWELKSCFGWFGDGFLLSASSFAFSFAWFDFVLVYVLQFGELSGKERNEKLYIDMDLHQIPDTVM